MSAGDTFQIARNIPGTPTRFVHGNTVMPYTTSAVSMGFTISKAAVFDRGPFNDDYIILPRADIVKKYVLIMYCPVLSIVPGGITKRSGLAII